MTPLSDDPAAADLRRRIDAVWRMEAARVIGGLARVTRDPMLAEDLAQDALLAALEQWPQLGVPDNPGAWFTAVARRRWVDGVRREITYERKLEELGRDLTEDSDDPMADIDTETTVSDDVLRLIFTACHPVLAPEARVALTLRMIGGLSTEETARAFLVPTPTMAARITRAKKALADARVPFEVPAGPKLAARLTSVLEVVYLVFNEGYAATGGRQLDPPDPVRGGDAALPDPGRPGAARSGGARSRGADGDPGVAAASPHRPGGETVLLLDQDRSRWDRLLITHALQALARAVELGGAGPYVLQASIAACHARAATAEQTDWPRISALYGELVDVTDSPVAELNRAVAVGMADGPAAGLVVLDELVAEDVPALRRYHLLPTVRGDLLMKLGRRAEARVEFERAAALTANGSERALLLARAAASG